jgi:hypothetical protein
VTQTVPPVPLKSIVAFDSTGNQIYSECIQPGGGCL